jgi:DNA-binding NarL/FixJ family response regulator
VNQAQPPGKDTLLVLLIEDNILLQEGIEAMLTRHGGFTVVARSEDGDSVLQLKSLDTPPDIVLLDIGLENANSLDLMALLKREAPDAGIIAMDVLPEHTDVVEFVRAGGRGFIMKNASAAEWVATIHAVASGETVLPPILTDSLFTQIIEDAVSAGKTFRQNGSQLTQRELQVVQLIAEGMSNKEIASTLHIATYTVKSHVHNILEKLTLNSRLQIAAHVRKEEM